LLGDGLRRWWEPDVRDARGGDVIYLAHQEVVPPAILLPRLPVETLRATELKTQSKTWSQYLRAEDNSCRVQSTESTDTILPETGLARRPSWTTGRGGRGTGIGTSACPPCSPALRAAALAVLWKRTMETDGFSRCVWPGIYSLQQHAGFAGV
jgi:hypothetical protein